MSKILPELLVSFKDYVEKIKVAGKDLFSVKLEPVSEYGLSYLKHLLSEYDVTVARLKKKAEDLEWQSKHVDIIRTKLTNSDPSICWNDISKLEQVVLSVTPDDGLVAKTRELRRRYKLVEDDNVYLNYQDSLPKAIANLSEIKIKEPDVKTALQEDLYSLVVRLYLSYDSITETSKLRYNAKWWVAVFLIGIVLYTAWLVNQNWKAAVATCGADIQEAAPVALVFAVMGACGACVSFLRRLSQLPGNIEALGGIIELRKSWIDALIAILSGGFFAILLLIIFASHTLETVLNPAVLPQFRMFDDGCIKAPVGTIVWFINSLAALDPAQMAKVLTFCFVAGFAEQFVPDVINKFVKLSDVSKK